MSNQRIAIFKCRKGGSCDCGCWIVAYGRGFADEYPCDEWEHAIEFAAQLIAKRATS